MIFEDEKLLTAHEAATFSTTELGVPLKASTLGKLRCVGGGPKFFAIGRRRLYLPTDVRAWVAGKATRRASTSDPGIPLISNIEPAAVKPSSSDAWANLGKRGGRSV